MNSALKQTATQPDWSVMTFEWISYLLNYSHIVTLDQKDKFEKEGYTVTMLPAHAYLALPSVSDNNKT
jgi:hypothetical protein